MGAFLDDVLGTQLYASYKVKAKGLHILNFEEVIAYYCLKDIEACVLRYPQCPETIFLTEWAWSVS